MRSFAVCVSLVRSVAVCDVIDGTCVYRTQRTSVCADDSGTTPFVFIDRTGDVCADNTGTHEDLDTWTLYSRIGTQYDKEYDP